MTDDEQVLHRLDTMIALMQIGFADSLERVRAEMAEDKISSAILERTKDGWVSSGDLQRSVSRSVGVSERTVLRTLIALSARGLIRAEGTGKSTRYRSSEIL